MFHLTNVFWDLVETGVIVPIQTMHYVGGKSPNCTIDSIRFASSLIPQNWVPFHKVADLSPIHFRKQSRKWYLRILNIGFQGLAAWFRAKSTILFNDPCETTSWIVLLSWTDGPFHDHRSKPAKSVAAATPGSTRMKKFRRAERKKGQWRYWRSCLSLLRSMWNCKMIWKNKCQPRIDQLDLHLFVAKTVMMFVLYRYAGTMWAGIFCAPFGKIMFGTVSWWCLQFGCTCS